MCPTGLSWFASGTVHFCIHPYNICGVASAHLYAEFKAELCFHVHFSCVVIYIYAG